jgi:Flp pilus assembly protein TadG
MSTSIGRRFFRSASQCEKGTSAVEFALLAPVMIFLVVGMIDIGRYAYYAVLASNAARAGAQYGAQDLAHVGQTTGIQSAASADGAPSTFSTTATCKVSVNNGAMAACPSGGTTPASGTVYYIQVTTTNSFNTLVPYPGISNPVSVTGSSTMRVASQ